MILVKALLSPIRDNNGKLRFKEWYEEPYKPIFAYLPIKQEWAFVIINGKKYALSFTIITSNEDILIPTKISLYITCSIILLLEELPR